MIFNNTRVKGLAGGVADKAKAAGWNVVGTDNWYGTVDGTAVYYPPRLKAAAEELGFDLGIKRIKPSQEPMQFDRLTVILTDDYPLTARLTSLSGLDRDPTCFDTASPGWKSGAHGVRFEPGEQQYAALVRAADDLVVGLDFDGTLAPIVDDPEEAHIHPDAGESWSTSPSRCAPSPSSPAARPARHSPSAVSRRSATPSASTAASCSSSASTATSDGPPPTAG